MIAVINIMKNNYREAECCNNCAFHMFEPDSLDCFCTLDKTFPGWKTKEIHIWFKEHFVFEDSVCDDFERIY
jgi:hypothetical protein